MASPVPPKVMEGSRGRVLQPSRGGSLRPPSPTAQAFGGVDRNHALSLGRFLGLLAVLPLFGQSFQYVVDVLPAYMLTKAWPLLTLPWAFWAFSRLRPPYQMILLATIVWTFAVTPLIGVFELGIDINSAISTTAKIWSLTTALSAAAVFAMLKVRPQDLTRTVYFWGVATFVIMVALWFLVPHSAYDNGLTETKLFLWDQERGYRVYMPMFFGSLLVFALNRSFWMRPRLWKLAAVGLCFYLLVLIFKQRTDIGALAVVVVIGAVLSLPRWRFPLLCAMGLALLLAAPALWGLAHSDSLAKSLGGSLTMRQMEIAKGLNFLNAQPHRWLFGAGSTTRFGDVSLASIVGAPGFYLADLGWMGVIFEYGAVGVLLLLLLNIAGLRITWQAAKLRDPVARATFDYALFILLTSPVLPPTFAPGELCTCMAMAFWYLHASREHSRTA